MKRNYLLGLAAVGALFSGGCDNSYKPAKYIEGVVIKEGGTITGRQQLIKESKGALFGNESVKIGKPTYVIQIELNDKVYTLGVYGYYETGLSKLEALAFAVEPGTKLRILNRSYPSGGFLKNVDSVDIDNIEVLGKIKPTE